MAATDSGSGNTIMYGGGGIYGGVGFRRVNVSLQYLIRGTLRK